MRKDIVTSLIAVVVLTVVLGVVYPLVVTGISQVVFPGAADGSRIERDGKLVGSRIIGQDFRRPVLDRAGKPKLDADGNPVLVADPRWFQSRPSSTSYNAAGTAFSNAGPNQKDTRDAIAANAIAYLALERPFNPGLTRADIPADAVQTSASSVDPHISIRNAQIQAPRIARVRRIPLARVRTLIDDNTDNRSLGILGQPGVNVLELNLAIASESSR
jgi:potassium-transporting ATPase KdpC subunit